ncbi:hypothetical protein, partial [Rhizobium sp. UGM030330-04]|uniref:hypothetical protein n=1 Tax=Rhizobium sp. UGM030330-04 TaxID=1378077 RepID=UPI001AED0D41
HRCAHNEVYSLVQNVTVKVYSRGPNLFRPRKLRRPRFSFFSYSIVKKQTAQAVTKSNPQSINPGKTTSIQLINLISLERKSSSPAAPPPSFSERTYKSITSNKSTAQITKNKKIRQVIGF